MINFAGLRVPPELVDSHRRYFGEAGLRWVSEAPRIAAELLQQWQLTPDGPSGHGAVAWVLPVRSVDHGPAVLKLQPIDDETVGEPVALQAWHGDGAIRLLDHDQQTGSLLLERADAERSLDVIEDDLAALQLLSELLARLSRWPAPPQLRRLSDIGERLLQRVPPTLAKIGNDPLRTMINSCAAALGEVLPESGDRLLHWDLHYQNVLGSLPDTGREPWLAIDPKPLAGDPGFELLPALHNRWSDVIARGEVAGALRRRFDLMTEVLDLDRDRATAWTLARVLQNVVWDIENDDSGGGLSAADRVIADVLLGRS
ncbi:hydroxyurea phosphotransferase [Microlunatus elymi]|uniref:Hydroxyurea phosphotransferase n=1 Tax=Microlunatus elymi TaxID=2596828 RepID=A0A516PZ57_9ACTN|nr:aminoglycoside phosphotransferase family protein [Microlunatus elymi]QDP96453.1 hydroxyurea phosphotransferase [Microlunatus elymi]